MVTTKPVEIKGETILVALFATWIFITVLVFAVTKQFTEDRCRIERLEDIALGQNIPLTQVVKPILK